MLAVPAIVCASLCAGFSIAGEPERASGPAATEPSFAVVELFTSEGCSSCPPADRVLAEMVKSEAGAKRGVYALSFHVDYWNNLGHPDRFSSAAFTQRQRDYATAFKERGVYTPQMIVNGVAEFVGSDAERAKREVDGALSKAGDVGVEIQSVAVEREVARGSEEKVGEKKVVENKTRPDSDREAAEQGERKEPSPQPPPSGRGSDGAVASRRASVEVTFSVRGATIGSLANVALIERGLETDVMRGENSGRVLKHENVVRAFSTITVGEGKAQHVKMDVPGDVVMKACSLIVYVQDAKTMRVLGAAGREKVVEPVR